MTRKYNTHDWVFYINSGVTATYTINQDIKQFLIQSHGMLLCTWEKFNGFILTDGN